MQHAATHIRAALERLRNYSQFMDPKCEKQHFESSSVPPPLISLHFHLQTC
jgi:hypothetical protein